MSAFLVQGRRSLGGGGVDAHRDEFDVRDSKDRQRLQDERQNGDENEEYGNHRDHLNE